MAKVLGLKQLASKKYNFLEDLPEDISRSFGKLVSNFIMIVWGLSGNGKSSLMMIFLQAILPHGKVLYVGLEEGFEATMQMNVMRNLNVDDHSGKIEFADHEMTFDALVAKLKKKKSPKFIIIDSLQYWNITYEQYKRLKQMFPRKSFIFISHANGKNPHGATATSIRYDAGIKVRVEGYVAFIVSRYGGHKPFVIWEEGAKQYWGKKYKKVIAGMPVTVQSKSKADPAPSEKMVEEPEQLLQSA